MASIDRLQRLNGFEIFKKVSNEQCEEKCYTLAKSSMETLQLTNFFHPLHNLWSDDSAVSNRKENERAENTKAVHNYDMMVRAILNLETLKTLSYAQGDQISHEILTGCMRNLPIARTLISIELLRPTCLNETFITFCKGLESSKILESLIIDQITLYGRNNRRVDLEAWGLLTASAVYLKSFNNYKSVWDRSMTPTTECFFLARGLQILQKRRLINGIIAVLSGESVINCVHSRDWRLLEAFKVKYPVYEFSYYKDSDNEESAPYPIEY